MPLFYPTLHRAERAVSVTDTFLGLNRRARIEDGEFHDMQEIRMEGFEDP